MPELRPLIEHIIVWAAPAVIVAAVFACVVFVQAFRKAHGAHRSTLGLTLVFAAVVLVLHGGYLLGPLWLFTGRRGLGLALMTPGALFFLIGVTAAAKSGMLRSIARSEQRPARRLSLGLLALAAAYIAPVAVMISGLT